jgi:D-alanyl-D-alanine carboxypeptidase
MVPFVFSGNYNGPGKWRYGLGFVESGGFIGGEGSFAGYESAAMCSPALETSIVVASTKNPNAITPPPMIQALAMAVDGKDVDSGSRPPKPRTQQLQRWTGRVAGSVPGRSKHVGRGIVLRSVDGPPAT